MFAFVDLNKAMENNDMVSCQNKAIYILMFGKNTTSIKSRGDNRAYVYIIVRLNLFIV